MLLISHHRFEKDKIFLQTLNRHFKFRRRGSFMYTMVLVSRVPLSKEYGISSSVYKKVFFLQMM